MKTRSAILIHFVIFIGCDRRSGAEERCVAGKEQRDFVISCIREGNPRSDEEVEDLVRQCEETSNRMFACYETTCMKIWHGEWTPVSPEMCSAKEEKSKQVKE